MTGSNMQYLDNIGSYLPGLPVESAWQFLQGIDTLYLAVAGEQLILKFCVFVINLKLSDTNSCILTIQSKKKYFNGYMKITMYNHYEKNVSRIGNEIKITEPCRRSWCSTIEPCKCWLKNTAKVA